VFDTAFHHTIPKKAYKYAIPNEFLEKNKIRVYGFHGTSHKYVSEKAIATFPYCSSKLITVHLGNGCSMTAIKDGKSIDHSLGFGPMAGLIMGTRSGDIDQSVILYLVKSLGYTLDEVDNILQKKSGMLGLTGYSDLREIEGKAEKGDENCQLALEMFAYRVKKYIGSYASVMNGVDTIVFTAGIGENSILLRKMICEDMDYLGIDIDLKKNDVKARDIVEISSNRSKVKILVIPTNEEIEIAKESYQLLS
jgi:acetate kinase